MAEPVPAFRTPGATPAGAGASHGGIVVPDGRPTIPPSPNKRVLPATKEPGIWAADETPRASSGPVRLFGVEIPQPTGAAAGVAEPEWCASEITRAADAVKRSAELEALPEPERSCVAAQAYLACAIRWVKVFRDAQADGRKVSSFAEWRAKETLKHALAVSTRNCQGVTRSAAAHDALAAVLSHWESTFKEYK